MEYSIPMQVTVHAEGDDYDATMIATIVTPGVNRGDDGRERTTFETRGVVVRHDNGRIFTPPLRFVQAAPLA